MGVSWWTTRSSFSGGRSLLLYLVEWLSVLLLEHFGDSNGWIFSLLYCSYTCFPQPLDDINSGKRAPPKKRALLEMRFLFGSPSGFSTRFKAAKCWKAVFFWGSEMHTPFQHGIYIYIYVILYIYKCYILCIYIYLYNIYVYIYIIGIYPNMT